MAISKTANLRNSLRPSTPAFVRTEKLTIMSSKGRRRLYRRQSPPTTHNHTLSYPTTNVSIHHMMLLDNRGIIYHEVSSSMNLEKGLASTSFLIAPVMVWRRQHKALSQTDDLLQKIMTRSRRAILTPKHPHGQFHVTTSHPHALSTAPFSHLSILVNS